MFARVGRVLHRWRWVVVGAWAVVAVAGAAFGGAVFDRLTTVDSLSPDAESALAGRRLDQIAPEGPTVVAVIHGVRPYDERLVASVSEISAALRETDGVREVDDLYTGRGGQIGADNNSSLVRIELVDRLAEARREEVEDSVVALLRGIDAPRVLVGGEDLARRAFAEQAIRDAATGESVLLVVLLVALVVVFGGLVAASIPLAVALTTLAATLLGLLAPAGFTEVSQYAVNVVTLLGIGLAVDYSLLLVARFREECGLDPQATPADAVAATLAGAGRAVLVSGLAVAAALAGLYAFAEPLLAAMALGGTVVVLIATAVALTLVPALLAAVRRLIPAARVRRPIPAARVRRPISAAGVRRSSPLAALAGFAQRRPAGVALAVTAALLVLAAPLLDANLANSDARALPRSAEARQAYESLQADFNSGRAPAVAVIAEVDPASPLLRDFLNRLNRLDGVFGLELRRDVAPGTTVVDLTPRGDANGPQGRQLVRAVRGVQVPFPVLVADPAAELVDYQRSLARRLPVAVLVVLLTTAVLLFGLTRSVVLPVKALAMNLLTLSATLGVLVVVFGWGWGAPLLGFEPWGAIDLTTPVLLFVFVFGLSMDYEVFLLARIKEEWDRHGDNDRAVRTGIAKSGRVVTSAAVCIGIVFLGFAFGDLVAVKEIGVGMAVAVLLDVTVVRGLLLPAVMTLLGEWNWWAPPWLRRA